MDAPYHPLRHLAVAAAALLLSLTTTTAPAQDGRPKVVAYVPTWVDLAAYSKQVDYSKLTHINLAFENPTNEEGDLGFHEKYKALIDRAHENRVQVLISICGGAASECEATRERYFRLISKEKRAGFVVKLVGYVERHGFDGLDVDLEGPAINEDYGAFVADLAKALRPKGKLLTAALSKGYGGDRVPNDALKQLNFLNVMAYDETGPWPSSKEGQHSSFEFAKESVAYWLGREVPKAEVVLGVPFYGRGFGAAGRGKTYPYVDIVRGYPGAENIDQVGQTIWYNGIPTIRKKAAYAVEHELGGVMIWALHYDAEGDRSLLKAVDEVLTVRRATPGPNVKQP